MKALKSLGDSVCGGGGGGDFHVSKKVGFGSDRWRSNCAVFDDTWKQSEHQNFITFVIYEWVNMEHLLNDTDRGKR
jgi:hypothetical protein